MYGKDNQYNDPLIEFASRKQLPKENIYNYLTELENLAEASHPDQPHSALETIVVDRFIRGIYDKKIKQELCKTPACNTIDEALKRAYELEEAFKRCNPDEDIITNDNQTKDTTTQLNPNDLCQICSNPKHLNKECFRQNPSLIPRNENKTVKACLNNSFKG